MECDAQPVRVVINLKLNGSVWSTRQGQAEVPTGDRNVLDAELLDGAGKRGSDVDVPGERSRRDAQPALHPEEDRRRRPRLRTRGVRLQREVIDDVLGEPRVDLWPSAVFEV